MFMGQHKYNPTAIAAKNREIKPKERPMSKKEREDFIYSQLSKTIGAPFTDITPYLEDHRRLLDVR